MLPLGLSLLLLGFWALVGQGLLAGVRARLGALRSWLLAPACGLAVQVLLVAIGNQMGWPVQDFARPLAVALLAAAVAVLWWRRPEFPGRALLPFAGAAILFLLWAGWPAFRYGFNWISYVNDDFTNYVQSAQRMQHFGYFRVPTLAELSGTDYPQYFWFAHVLALMRFGSEHAIAFAAALTGKEPLRVFMPVILALGGMQILAAAALVLHHGRWRRQAQLTAFLLAASPLFIFGALYQLIAQVGGLGLMLATIALFTAPIRSGRSRWRLVSRAVPMAIVASALAVFYPECSPFAGVAYGFFIGLEILRTRRFPGARIVALEYALILIGVCLRFNLISYMYTLGGQMAVGTKNVDLSLSLFPFFLIPQGMAMLFGLQPLNLQLDDPYQSLLIVLGMGLLIVALVMAVRRAWAVLPFGCLLLVQLVVGAKLFQAGNDFALYKLAMYIQPALLAGVAAGFLALFGRRRGAALAAGVLIVLMLPTGYYYASASQGSRANGMTEMQLASGYLSRRPPVPPAGTSWGSGIDNVVAVKIAASLYRGPDLRFLARDFFAAGFLVQADWPLMKFYPHQEMYAIGQELRNERDQALFADQQLFGTAFSEAKLPVAPEGYLNLPSRLSLFNKLQAGGGGGEELFTLQPSGDVHNLLSFVHSSLGNHYYLGDRRKISFLQQEPDPYRVGSAMNGIGRFFLFRVVNPTPTIYLRVAATKTVMGPANKNWSSAAVVHGQTDVPLGLVGAGGINRIVGPITPVWVDGGAYIAVDLAQAPIAFPIKRSGFANWYNRSVPLDYRRLVGFGRDISALSPAEYAALSRPRGLTHFPDDLAQAVGLEYSGLYEDHWMSPAANLILGAAHAGEVVRVIGYVPTLPGLLGQAAGRMTVAINGDAQSVPVPPGPFDWIFPIAEPGEKTRIDLRFSCPGLLPPGDDRPVGGQLRSITIEAAPRAFSFAAAGTGILPAQGIDGDGWAAPVAELALPVSAGSLGLEVHLDYPGWPGVPATGAVAISVDGAPPVRWVLKPGPNVFTLALRPGPLVRRLHLAADQSFPLPAPDGRVRSFRILSVAGLPAPAP